MRLWCASPGILPRTPRYRMNADGASAGGTEGSKPRPHGTTANSNITGAVATNGASRCT